MHHVSPLLRDVPVFSSCAFRLLAKEARSGAPQLTKRKATRKSEDRNHEIHLFGILSLGAQLEYWSRLVSGFQSKPTLYP